MTTITTVRAALQQLASEGWTPRNLFQLGSAMGPASLYVLSTTVRDRLEAVTRTDSAGRTWLQAFTAPHPSYFAPARVDRQLLFRQFTGAALLRLACADSRWLVLDATSPLECRIPLRTAHSLQVPAGYTEALVAGAARAVPADVPLRVPAAHARPRFDRERLAS